MNEKKIDRGLGGRRRPQRGPGAEPLVGVRGKAPHEGNALFTNLSDFALSK
jgi:hypothetical protein